MTEAKRQADFTTTMPEPVPGISLLAPYVQGKGRIQGHENPIKLSSNESNMGPSPKAIEAYKKAAHTLHRYPDGDQNDLRHAIAEVHDLNAAQIFCSNGSDEAIQLVIRAYVRPDDEVIVSQYGFVMARIHAVTQGARVLTAAEPDFTISVDNILDKLTPETRMVVIANPNNPAGRYVPASEIERLHNGLPEHVILLLDGAYAEYVAEPDFSAGADLVDRFSNVVMTRTFSKLYGLAGLRIGWAYCPANIFQTVQRIRTPFNATSASLAAAEAAVRDTAYTAGVCQHNKAWLKTFAAEFEALGLDVIPSASNCFLLRFSGENGKTAEAAYHYLLEEGIIVRPAINAGGPEDCLRITVGLDHENKAAIDVLNKFLNT